MKSSDQTAVEFGRGGGPMIGRTIAGKYRIRSRVGGGAMGVVYEAKQLALGKRVAIKVLNDDLQKNEHFVARFEVEARAASLLDHANSTRVFDFGKDESGLLYICMEFLEGKSLLQVIDEQGPLPAARVVDLTAQTLAALARAHDLGILHRDLKPENIMVLQADDDEGHARDVVKVCDFGIAKFDGRSHLTNTNPPSPADETDFSSLGDDDGARAGVSEAPSGKWKASSALTQVGLIIGTPDYMSPEQAKGEAVDVRSEIYSMGVVLYHMLAGRVPFEGGDVLETLTRHMTLDPEPPSRVRPGVDEELESICRIAMSKDPAVRYRTARDMRAALRSTAACGRVGGGRAQMFSFVPPAMTMRLSQGEGGPGLSMMPSMMPLGPSMVPVDESLAAPLEISMRASIMPALSAQMAPAMRALLRAPAAGMQAGPPPLPVPRMDAAAALGVTVRAPAPLPMAMTAPLASAVLAETRRAPPILLAAESEPPMARRSWMGRRSISSSRAPALPVARLALQETTPRRRPLALVMAAGMTAMFLGTAFALGAPTNYAAAAAQPPAPTPHEVEVTYAAVAAPLAIDEEPGPTGGAVTLAGAAVPAAVVPSPTAIGSAATSAPAPASSAVRLARGKKGYGVDPVDDPSPATTGDAPAFHPENGRVAVVREDAQGFDRHLVNEVLGHAALESCYREALKDKGSAVTGSTLLTLHVDAGKVTGMSLGTSLGLDALGSCLEPRIVGQALGKDGEDETASGTAFVTLQLTDL